MILRRIATEGGYRNINYFSGLVQRVADDLENIHVDFDEDSPTYGEKYLEDHNSKQHKEGNFKPFKEEFRA